MVAKIIDGKAIAEAFTGRLRAVLESGLKMGKPLPGLAVVLVGEDPASTVYVQNKQKACKALGMHSAHYALPSTVSEPALVNLLQQLNHDPMIHGILVQLPLPSQINTQTILECILPTKDVDGFHPFNLGRLAQRAPLLRPCTPYGIMRLLAQIGVSCRGKHAVIVGASNIVGRPMALEFLIAGATVTICHRNTQDLASLTRQADILVSAVGKPQLITEEMVREGGVVIDVGISRLPNGKLTGDVCFEAVREKASWITPVPGGVGPMTVAMLLHNTLCAAGFSLEGV